jgi:hypothetical protein
MHLPLKKKRSWRYKLKLRNFKRPTRMSRGNFLNQTKETKTRINSSPNALKNHLGSSKNQNQKTSRNRSFGTRWIRGIVLLRLEENVTENTESTKPQIVKAKHLYSIQRRKGNPSNKAIMKESWNLQEHTKLLLIQKEKKRATDIKKWWTLLYYMVIAQILKIGSVIITTYILMYAVLVFYHICFYQDVENKVKGSAYVPKLKRNKFLIWVNSMKTWLINKMTIIEETLMKKIHVTRHQKLQRAYIATKRLHNKSHHKTIPLMIFTAILAMNAKSSNIHNNRINFDTDSEPIGVDNWCTGCISHHIEDFEGPLNDSERIIKGFGGSRTLNVKIGTLVGKWFDDDGK